MTHPQDPAGPSPDLSIRQITRRQSFLEVLPLFSTFFTGSGLPDPETAGPQFEKAVQEGYRLYVAFDETGVPVGAFGLRAMHDPLEPGPSFEINNLVVAEPVRGRGIGTSLLEYAHFIAGQEGAIYTSLLNVKDNTEMHDFYAKRGYREVCSLLLNFFRTG